jgi:DNA polymerase III epsilon subunit-like protein
MFALQAPECAMRGVADWMKQLRDAGYPFPTSYFVFDVETSGLNPAEDLITQFGHADVRDRKIIHNDGYILDWPSCGALIRQDWLRERLSRTVEEITRRGGTYRFAYDKLRGGKEPVQLLQEYHDFLKDWQDRGGWFLTHNGFQYDSRIVEAHFRRFLWSDFRLDLNRVLDTGLLEKGMGCDLPFYPDETVVSYHQRVSNYFGRGVMWSLDRHCIPKYKLHEKHAFDMRETHTAGFDCRATHCLFEEFRQLSED